MFAMQYRFTLPADYDMAIIRRRIAERGHLTDQFPGLAFKAYLYNERAEGDTRRLDNAYAPFYLWHDNGGMNAFLASPGFAGLVQNFGRPTIETWSGWASHLGPQAHTARFATRETVTIPAQAKLGEWQEAAQALLAVEGADPAIAATVIAFEPLSWTRIHFRLWYEAPGNGVATDAPCYRVGYLSV